MDPLTTGFVAIALMLVLLLFKVPVAVATAVAGFAGFAYLAGIGPALTVLGSDPFARVASYSLTAIPLFVLMGLFCFHAGISQDLFQTSYTWLGRLRGGVAMATVGGCAGFAAVSGSSAATAATMAAVALPEMKRYNYESSLATGSLAAGGTIGILIPPSNILILYGIMTETSVGKLFAAGIFPGILEAVSYIVVISILCRINPLMGPAGPKTSWREKAISLKNVWPVLALFVLVVGGIYMGIFTPTEAGAIGAFGAFLLIIGKRRLTWRAMTSALREAIQITAMIMFIVIGAMVFAYFLTITQMPMRMADWAAGLEANKYVVLTVIIFFFILLGCIMDAVVIMLIVTPVIFPLVIAMGFDPIWFGIIMIRVVEIGFITPPVGLNIYIIKGVAKDVPLTTMFRGIVPFLLADIVMVTVLVAFPQISLFLPNLMS